MKLKSLIPIILSIVIGFFFGKVLFSSYDKTSINAFNEGEKVYFVEIGTYKNLDDLKKVTSYDSYLYKYENNYYHLYAGITKSKEIANKIKEFFKESSNNIYVQEKYINNLTFINILTEYDKVASIAVSNKDLMSIEKIIISNYKEMVLQE